MTTSELIGRYRVLPFPRSRTLSVDTVRIGRRKHHIPVLIEIDITESRRRIAAEKVRTGEALSLTGWVVTCLARAAAEYPETHASRQGRHLVIFEDVDVGLLIDRPIAGAEPPTRVPMPYVVRRANRKDLATIHREIRAAQTEPLGNGQQVIDPRSELPFPPRSVRWFYALPSFLRDLILWRRMLADPILLKRLCGTITVTSAGMFGRHATGSGWGIPIGFAPMVVAVGGITRRPGFDHGRIVPRELLCLTFLFDHDVVDGARMAEFLECLNGLMDSGYALPSRQTEGTLEPSPSPGLEPWVPVPDDTGLVLA